ncbi:signal peptidase I [Chloroflexota bacterium]
MKKVAGNIGFALAVLLMVAAALTYLAPHLGWQVNVVLSGSMEPQLKVGGLVVTRPIEPEAIAVGDIIIYRPIAAGENLISHRVVDVQRNSPLSFQTKGDANDDPDPFLVPAQNVVGKIGWHIPFLGYATQFLKTPPGFLLALVIPGLAIIVTDVRNIRQVLIKEKKKAGEAVRQ